MDSQPRKEAIEFWNKLQQNATKKQEQKREEL